VWDFFLVQSLACKKFIMATDVARALVEQLPIAVRMAEIQKRQGR
jgi:hypothetical protein